MRCTRQTKGSSLRHVLYSRDLHANYAKVRWKPVASNTQHIRNGIPHTTEPETCIVAFNLMPLIFFFRFRALNHFDSTKTARIECWYKIVATLSSLFAYSYFLTTRTLVHRCDWKHFQSTRTETHQQPRIISTFHMLDNSLYSFNTTDILTRLTIKLQIAHSTLNAHSTHTQRSPDVCFLSVRICKTVLLILSPLASTFATDPVWLVMFPRTREFINIHFESNIARITDSTAHTVWRLIASQRKKNGNSHKNAALKAASTLPNNGNLHTN